MKTFILIDISYFIFYRYYALISWWKLAKPDDNLGNPYDNEEFVEKFKKTFIEKINEIPKKLKIKEFKLLGAKDCSRSNIWRNELYNDYKGNRIYDDDFMGGPFFNIGLNILKELNIPILFNEKLEADDCIAIYTREMSNENNIFIIANDMDYLQLLNSNVKIFNLKFKDISQSSKWSGNAEQDLFTKIVIGDKSDNIPALFTKCGPKKALHYFNNRNEFEEILKKENALENFERNKKLVDFREIPEHLQEEFYSNYLI